VRQAINALAPGQRAVLVLRFWADLDIAATAKAMGCTTGTVKSQTARALGRLRELLGDEAAVAHRTTENTKVTI
jgi:RNA polymerase sigma factor (sigma-70 family)